MSRALSLVLALAVLMPLRVASADPTVTAGDVAEHRNAALAAYTSHDYVKAAAEFAIVYQLAPGPDSLYAWAQAVRLAGDCERARTLYLQFLAGQPEAIQAEAARKNIDRCVPAVVPTPQTPPVPAPVVSPAPVTPRQPQTSAPPPVRLRTTPARAWYKDAWGGGLVGGGLVAVGIGIGYYLSASSAQSEAESAFTYQEYSERTAAAHSRRVIGTVSTTLGAVLLAGGITRYLLVGRRQPITEVAAVPAAHGFALALSGSF